MASDRYVLILSLLISVVRRINTACSPIYGQTPCNYLPAPPGHAPSCARPGYTYCEHPNNYPGHLIQHLIEKWRHDHKTLFIDEAEYDFNAYFLSYDDNHNKYNTINNRPIYGPLNSIQNDKLYPEPIYIPKPSYTAVTSDGKTYIPPPPPLYQIPQNFTDYLTNNAGQYVNTPYPKGTLNYNNNKYFNQAPYNHLHQQQQQQQHQQQQQQQQQNYYGQQNDWLKTYPQQNYYNHLRNKRSLKLLRNRRRRYLDDSPLYGNQSSNNGTTSARKKRQNNQQKLCDTRSRYVMPRAAANKEGQWLYLVNIPGYTQQVNTETCASQQCAGLCVLPSGYTSRCEQKYVQKRLVALDGSGSTLMNDLFWFPVCCVCMLSN